jgi:hypothetical protein
MKEGLRHQPWRAEIPPGRFLDQEAPAVLRHNQ